MTWGMVRGDGILVSSRDGIGDDMRNGKGDGILVDSRDGIWMT